MAGGDIDVESGLRLEAAHGGGRQPASCKGPTGR